MTNSFNMRTNANFILTCVTVFCLSGCANSYSASKTLQTNQTFDAAGYDAAHDSTNYKPVLQEKTFKIGDVATITVNGFKEFSGIYTVGNDGNIFLGHIGNVNVAGQTISQVQTNLRKKYSTCCLVNPNVSVEREGQLFGKIVVDGAVNDPGVFEIDGIIKLSEAVALGGGTSELANRETVILARVIDGERRVSQINLKEIQLAGADDPLVYPNDVIFVRDSKGRILYNDFIKTIPLISAVILTSRR